MLTSSFSNNASNLPPGESSHANGVAEYTDPGQATTGSSILHGTMRREPPTASENHPAGRTSRKRKSPSTSANDSPQTSQQSTAQSNAPGPVIHSPPRPRTLIQPHPATQGGHMGLVYAYDYSPGGMPPPSMYALRMSSGGIDSSHKTDQAVDQSAKGGRPLPSQSNGAEQNRKEQNRKAQRAFRERRDQHVKNLEARSQLLNTALTSADEANRRWEECRAIVDQLRVENAQLRSDVSGLRQGLSQQYTNDMREANGSQE